MIYVDASRDCSSVNARMTYRALRCGPVGKKRSGSKK